MTKSAPENTGFTLRHKVTFLNSVFLFGGIVAFCMGFYRWQTAPLLGSLDFLFAAGNLALFFFLKQRQDKIELVSSLTLLQGYSLFTVLYFFAPYNTTRITLFFLLAASVVFLKESRVRWGWLLLILLTILAGNLLPGIHTGYSSFDILCALLYLVALFLICGNFELFKHRTSSESRSQEVLRDSEERFRTLVERGSDIICIITESGNIQFISPSVTQITGYTPEEVTGKHIVDLLHADDREPAAAALARTLSGSGSGAKYEFRIQHKNGDYRHIEIGGRNLLDNPAIQGILLNGRDITERKQAEENIELSKQQLDTERKLFQTILDNAPIGIWMLDASHKLKFVNRTFCSALGIPEEQLLSAEHYSSVLPSPMSESCMSSDMACLKQAPLHLSTEWVPFVDGKEHLMEITKVRLQDHNNQVIGLIGLATDITGRKQAEDRSRLTAKVFENTLEGILITDVSGNIIEVNDSFCSITGYSREELLGKNPRVLHSGHHPRSFYEGMWQTISTTGHWSGEIWNRNSHGDLYAEWLTISAIHDDAGKATHYVGICSDITVLKQHERQLERIAHYDALTGIPNRTLLSDRMHQALSRTAREQNMLAVCYLDLDGFKPINDQLGHEAGDRVLIEIARRIQQTIRGGDTVARLGGDEFVILLLGLERGDECIHTLNRLLASIAQTIEINGSEFSLSASIGVSIYPLDDEDSDTLLRHADQAMYLAKQSGKNRFHIYDPALDQRTRNQQKLFRSIQDGLHEGQFELYYQPKVALESQQLVGVEALVRWNHPELGLLPPGGFLPAIENTELDIALGEWVIATALAQIADWHQSGLKISVSINISAYHLESPEFIERLKTLLSQHPDWLAQQLEIEVLETVALEDISKVSHIIESCKKFGIGFALDDFGTGYSSLSYLSSLPIDTLKIDQSFMRDLALGKRDHAIVLGIIALSRAFGLTTIAEGIETPEQFQALLDMGCDTGQGYGIARPMPAHALPAWSQKYGMGNLLSHIANPKE